MKENSKNEKKWIMTNTAIINRLKRTKKRIEKKKRMTQEDKRQHTRNKKREKEYKDK